MSPDRCLFVMLTQLVKTRINRTRPSWWFSHQRLLLLTAVTQHGLDLQTCVPYEFTHPHTPGRIPHLHLLPLHRRQSPPHPAPKSSGPQSFWTGEHAHEKLTCFHRLLSITSKVLCNQEVIMAKKEHQKDCRKQSNHGTKQEGEYNCWVFFPFI